ncbi:DUF6702 family protein [Pseudoalteromonas peptidolytica]|uniref:Orphan protein n=1 Tax=Pseudoalteromonas peptidolytica F12-50-A1 TaxID=1315280 RepID=A0A8I0N102_9GAMM|nr:DUF6702 family protein [Pseudoalteromonas peptidolytica]MBE0348913.1 hypothetical protein [Pseudoalteromonas peptidolytica F12-50-A1]NLR16345.1 hypothetical protein [Pseudoalteromonas peptidolytica]GEK10407.1 hypothetical protein PPE03_26560 [Pseudoalteromonas peptidolytica]
MRIWYFCGVLILLMLSSLCHAHQLKAAITTVLFNERSGNIEIMHRFYLHDTEHAIEHLFSQDADIFNNQKDRDNFASYVSKRVELKATNGKALPLQLVGAEIDGQFFWVYQQTPLFSPITALNMRHGALRDVWPQQVNLVNFEGKGKVKSLHFDGSDDWLKVTF